MRIRERIHNSLRIPIPKLVNDPVLEMGRSRGVKEAT